MKASACVKCRQWKARCDAVPGDSSGCSRCRALGVTCIFDPTYKRVVKKRNTHKSASDINFPRPTNQSTTSPLSPLSTLCNNAVFAPFAAAESPLPGQLSAAGIIEHAGMPGDVCLTEGQISGIFRCFFTRCHRYIPFEMTSREPEVIRERSPLLFWVICAVASEEELRAQLAPRVKRLVLNVFSTPLHTVETVQALLLLCLWPFRASFRTDDPSYFYSGLATQISLMLGLHRPSQTHTFRHEWDCRPIPASTVKTTTWLACYVVNHQLANFNGVPPSVPTDPQLLEMLDEPWIHPNLVQLCRIHCLLGQSLQEISCNGGQLSGLQDPCTRMQMIQRFREQLATLQLAHLEPMSDTVKVAFLHARIQMLSFAMQEDMAPSPELDAMVVDLESDACDLIDLCHNMNLATAPNYFWLAVAYTGCVIVRILQSQLCSQRETLEDKFMTMQQALRSVAASKDDMSTKASLVLQALHVFKDIKQSPPILSRMSAWISYDCRRIYWENWTKNGLSQYEFIKQGKS